MRTDDTAIAIGRFIDWLTERHSAKRAFEVARASLPAAQVSERSPVMTFCLYLIYYFCLCDSILKYLPASIAIPLRYLPEAAMYIIALRQLGKGRRVMDFPLFWPLCVCAAGMLISAVLNSVSVLAALEDFRLYYRFATFAFIAWVIGVTPDAILRIMKGFLGLAAIQMGVGTLELVAGQSVQMFFAPMGGWLGGNAGIATNLTFGEAGWIFGTLSNYNHFGTFMVMSCVIALAVYLITGARLYLGMAFACAVFVVLSFSRHSLLTLAATTLCFYALRSRANVVNKVFKGVAIGAVLLIAVVEVARIANPELESRLATLVSPKTLTMNSESNIRLYILATLPPKFLTSYPLFGQGPLDVGDTAYGDDRDIFLAPSLKAAPNLPGILTFYLGDVVWVMILGLYGMVGLGGFFYILWRTAKSANRIRGEDSSPARLVLAQVYLSLMAAFIVSGFFSEEIIARDCVPIFWLLAGMTLSSASALVSEKQQRFGQLA